MFCIFQLSSQGEFGYQNEILFGALCSKYSRLMDFRTGVPVIRDHRWHGKRPGAHIYRT